MPPYKSRRKRKRLALLMLLCAFFSISFQHYCYYYCNVDVLFKYASIGSKTIYTFHELYDRLGLEFGRQASRQAGKHHHMSMHFPIATNTSK